MTKGMRHTPEARAKIGAASRARGAAQIALAASVAKSKAARACLPKPEPRKRLTPEERRAASRACIAKWTAENPAKAKAIKRRSYEKHREALNAKQRENNKKPERKAFMREYAPKHRAMNPDLYLTYSQNRRAAEIGADGSHTEVEWLALVNALGNRCTYCGSEGKLTRDHDVPLARGGSNNIGNIKPACARCNSRKGTLTAEEFVARLRGEGPTMDARWAAQLAKARHAG